MDPSRSRGLPQEHYSQDYYSQEPHAPTSRFHRENSSNHSSQGIGVYDRRFTDISRRNSSEYSSARSSTRTAAAAASLQHSSHVTSTEISIINGQKRNNSTLEDRRDSLGKRLAIPTVTTVKTPEDPRFKSSNYLYSSSCTAAKAAPALTTTPSVPVSPAFRSGSSLLYSSSSQNSFSLPISTAAAAAAAAAAATPTSAATELSPGFSPTCFSSFPHSSPFSTSSSVPPPETSNSHSMEMMHLRRNLIASLGKQINDLPKTDDMAAKRNKLKLEHYKLISQDQADIIAILKKEKAEQTTQLAEANKQLAELQKMKESLQTAQKMNDALNQQVRDLHQQFQQSSEVLNRKIVQFQRQNESSQTEKRDLLQEIEDLKKTLNTQREENAKHLAFLQQTQEQLTSQLKETDREKELLNGQLTLQTSIASSREQVLSNLNETITHFYSSIQEIIQQSLPSTSSTKMEKG